MTKSNQKRTTSISTCFHLHDLIFSCFYFA